MRDYEASGEKNLFSISQRFSEICPKEFSMLTLLTPELNTSALRRLSRISFTGDFAS
jgi:hypothetical protein